LNDDPRALFRSLDTLRRLNVVGVGLALATLVGASSGAIFTREAFSNPAAFSTAVPTLVVGTAWALLLRREQNTLGSKIWAWWRLSVLLAILNTSLCSGLLSAYGKGLAKVLGVFLISIPLAATIGVVYWLPALSVVLVLFGLPIAWAQRQARRGLVGEERGELIVSLTVTVISLLGLALASHRTVSGEENWLTKANMTSVEENWIKHVPIMGDVAGLEAVAPLPVAWRLPDSGPTALLVALGVLGVAAGALATAMAWRRDRARQRFVAQVQEGRVAGYRVDETEAGRVLVRVQGLQEYRAIEEEEALFALDEASTTAPGNASAEP
jgi:hypothetical protein